MILFGELEKAGEELLAAYFNELSQNSLDKQKEPTKKHFS
jgi:hypothetical protein